MPAFDMQEKRNKRQVVIFLVLVAGIALALTMKPGRSSFEVPADYYRQFDLREVDRVVMKSNDQHVTLQFKGNRWEVNNAFPADRDMVEVLFATLQQTEPKRPVATSLRDSVGRELRQNGVHVELFDGENQVEEFYAGGNAAKTQAYFLKAAEETPHLVVIPGYRVYVSGIFELPANQWFEKLIFDFNWTNFRKLETGFRNPAGDFSVEMTRNSATIPEIAEPDTARLNTFLDNLSLLRADEYLAANPRLDSLSATRPLAEYRITDIGGRVYFLRVFDFQDRFVALTHSGQFAVLSKGDLLPLLRPKEFFVKR